MIKYFFILSWIAPGVLAIGLSGCRLGNRVSQATADPYTGYYASQPQTYEIFVTYNSQTHSGQQNPSQIPAQVTQLFTNPEIFVHDPTSGVFAIAPWNASGAIPVSFDTTQKTFSFPNTPLGTYYWDSCAIQQTIDFDGSLQDRGTNDPVQIALNGRMVPINGRLQATANVHTTFYGDCTSALQGMRACYDDVTKCPSDSNNAQSAYQGFVAEIFEPALTAGLMTESDIETTSNIVYTAQYE